MAKSDDNGEADDRKKSWEDLIFSTIDKIASTPGKLKDPSGAFEWVKGIRDEVQDRIRDEVSQRIGKLDWNILAKKVGEHLAEKYRLKIQATVEWVPKDNLQDFSVKTEKVDSSTDDEQNG